MSGKVADFHIRDLIVCTPPVCRHFGTFVQVIRVKDKPCLVARRAAEPVDIPTDYRKEKLDTSGGFVEGSVTITTYEPITKVLPPEVSELSARPLIDLDRLDKKSETPYALRPSATDFPITIGFREGPEGLTAAIEGRFFSRLLPSPGHEPILFARADGAVPRLYLSRIEVHMDAPEYRIAYLLRENHFNSGF